MIPRDNQKEGIRITELSRHPFAGLPEAERARNTERIKAWITREASRYGGRFVSHLAPPPDRAPHPQWYDLFFLGADPQARPRYWNASVVTARQHYRNQARIEAIALAVAALEAKGIDVFAALNADSLPYPQFGGRTLREQVNEYERQIFDTRPPVIYEMFQTDETCSQGIGLNVVLDAPSLDRFTLEALIDRFYATGETDWRAPDPVPPARLNGPVSQEQVERPGTTPDGIRL